MTQPSSKRSGGRSARIKQRSEKNNSERSQASGFAGGQYKPLSDHDVNRIHEGALHILETVGMGVIGNLPPGAKEMLEQGATLSDSDRILIPRAKVEDILAKTCRTWTLHGLDRDRSIEISPGHVHYGTRCRQYSRFSIKAVPGNSTV